MRLVTYQSENVLKILQQGKIYRAKPSISFKKEYQALMEMTKLKCDCPVFAVVKGKKQNTSGRVSGSIKMELEVPVGKIKFTEFSVWANFMYGVKFAKGTGYKKISIDGHSEVSQKDHDQTIKELSTQKSLKKYVYPQALLEEIQPEWLISYKKMHSSQGIISAMEKLKNIFR